MAAVAVTLSLVGYGSTVVNPAAANAGGHDPASCSPDVGGIPIPNDFYLDACFDGDEVILSNRTTLPVYVDLTGLQNNGRSAIGGGAPSWASLYTAAKADHLLAPEFKMRVKIDNEGGRIKLGYAGDTGRQHLIAQQLSTFLPGALAISQNLSDYVAEVDAAWVKMHQCFGPEPGAWQRVKCTTEFGWNVDFASRRFALKTGLSLLSLSGLKGALLTFVQFAADVSKNVDSIAKDLPALHRANLVIDVPPNLIAPLGGGNPTPTEPQPTRTSPAPEPTHTPPPPPPPPPTVYDAQQGSQGANTFTNPYNASGMGEKIPAMAWVKVSCKFKPETTIASASPDGYWYRIASAPWNNNYYAVANTFWNGDTPGVKPYTHNTDFNIPDC